MCDANFATPANTVGMGNSTAPGENGEVGSGDVLTPIEKPKKRKMNTRGSLMK